MHILPRVLAQLAQERSAHRDEMPINTDGVPSAGASVDYNSVLFKSDRIYQHQLLRINYTTYDVRRDQDVINPRTSRRDVMVLADNHDDDTHSGHPFWYARVLGIYHVNVVYTGPGMIDYTARRVDFLWVRWFRYVGATSVDWKDYKLDAVAFPTMSDEHAFGFIDPNDVLRACHIIPAFVHGKLHPDTISLSRCARDAHDWRSYYTNRFAVELLHQSCTYDC
jgi:hypothetical protein